MWLGKEKETQERKRKERIHIIHSNLVLLSSAVELPFFFTYFGQDIFRNEVDEGLLVLWWSEVVRVAARKAKFTVFGSPICVASPSSEGLQEVGSLLFCSSACHKSFDTCMCNSCSSDIILNTDLWMGRFIPSLNCCWILTFVYWAKLDLCFLEQLTKLPHISEHLSIFLPLSNMNCYTALCWGPHSSCQSLLNTFPRVNTGANKKKETCSL